MENRLQFRHENTLFESVDQIRDYIFREVKDTEGRLALYAEPIVFKYGDENNPSIVLAIGSVGDGTKNSRNEYYLIDTATIINDLSELTERVDINEESIEEISGITASIIKTLGVNEDGTYDTPDHGHFKDIDNFFDSLWHLDELLNNYDSTLDEIITKLDTIEEGAQVNKLESVSVNGELLEIDKDKNVNVEVPFEKVQDGDLLLSLKDRVLSSEISLKYDSAGKKIQLYGREGILISEVDAAEFVKDGMISRVEVVTNPSELEKEGEYLHIIWNTDAGKEESWISLEQFFNIYHVADGSKYYMKIEGYEISLSVDVAHGLASYESLVAEENRAKNAEKELSAKDDAQEAEITKNAEDIAATSAQVVENRTDLDSVSEKLGDGFSGITVTKAIEQLSAGTESRLSNVDTTLAEHEKTLNEYHDDIKLLSGNTTANAENISKNADDIKTNRALIDTNIQGIEELNDKVGDGFTTYTITHGIEMLSASTETLKEAVSGNTDDINSLKTIAGKGFEDYSLTHAIQMLSGSSSGVTETVKELKEDVEVIKDTIGSWFADTTITDVVTELSGKTAENSEKIDTNSTDIDALENKVGSGFKDTTVTDVVTELSGKTATIDENTEKIKELEESVAEIPVYGVEKVSTNTYNFLENGLIKSTIKFESDGVVDSAAVVIVEGVKYLRLFIAGSEGKYVDIALDDLVGKLYTVADDSVTYLTISDFKVSARVDVDGGLVSYKLYHKLQDIIGPGFGTYNITHAIEMLMERIEALEAGGSGGSGSSTGSTTETLTPTLPSVSLTFTPETTTYLVEYGTDVEIGEATLNTSDGAFDSTYIAQDAVEGVTWSNKKIVLTVGDSVIAEGTDTISGYTFTPSLGANITIKYEVSADYTAPTNYPKSSKGTYITSGNGSWEDGTATAAYLPVFTAVRPLYTNISGTTLSENAETKLELADSNVFTVEFPSEGDEGELRMALAYPSGMTITKVEMENQLVPGVWNEYSTDNYKISDGKSAIPGYLQWRRVSENTLASAKLRFTFDKYTSQE